MAGDWKSGEPLAWTEHDGPGRPPASPRRSVQIAVAVTLAAVFVGVMSTDALCPEHQVWVDVLGVFALAGTSASVVGLVRGWASSWWLCLLSASCGVAIGAIDSIHDATRGALIALAFGIVAVGCVVLGFWAGRLRAWETRTSRSMKIDAAPPRIAATARESRPVSEAEPTNARPDTISATPGDVDQPS